MTFEIGDRCIGQNARWNYRYNGVECVVVGELAHRHWVGQGGLPGSGLAYRVQWVSGEVTSALPDQLRLRNQPASEYWRLGEWELCPWRPSQVTVPVNDAKVER